MKKMYKTIFGVAVALGLAFNLEAQTVADFENLDLNIWNGSDQSGGFESNGIFFQNEYNDEWNFWSDGFAISNLTDSVTQGSGNMYSVRTGTAYGTSDNFIVSSGGAVLEIMENSEIQNLEGMYISNSTYAARSMEFGDDFGKEFGSPYDANGELDGTDGEDWFLLTITGYLDGVEQAQTVEFYLADYRSANEEEHYILDSWEWIDLTPLGEVDSLHFGLSSSDVGDWGMNTPSFFCMDNITYLNTESEQEVLTFDEFELRYWNGSDLTGGFESGNGYFPNEYDTEWEFWDKGFAYSNMKDTETPGTENIYSTFAGEGYDGSDNFGLGKGGSVLHLTGDAQGNEVAGFYVTNTTYAAISMRDGDQFAKQFGSPYDANGEEDGTDGKDWFLLTVTGYLNGEETTEEVEFYLADYRSDNEEDHYILDTWEWVDLTPLGNVDSIEFSLTSSDVGDWGMNTPSFFAMDNFITNDAPTSINQVKVNEVALTVFPNPTTDYVNIETKGMIRHITIFDMTGRIVKQASPMTNNLTQLNLSELKNGVYLVEVKSENGNVVKKVVKR